MHEVRGGWWGDDAGIWMDHLFGDNASWHFWTPELIREISGASTCAMPPLPDRGASLEAALNVWGPFLPLLHFHLGWPRVDLGLIRWASMGFDPIGDPTLRVIASHWGPGLATATLWSVATSGAPEGPTIPASMGAELQGLARGWSGHGPEGLHLENHYSLDCRGHWAAAYDTTGLVDDIRQLSYELRFTGPRRAWLIVPTYARWYRTLELVAELLPELDKEPSWGILVTIAPIGNVGTFRRSRISGRWFTGRHRAHEIGFPHT